ncbi:MAG: P-loop NTPase [Clostridia bacterium]|nr:P-loop NTPase [Clostridia bacterium]
MEVLPKRAKIILVTSCKGGVGKSTVSANLGMALALKGRRTLLIDCDFGIRCLDVITGLTDSAVYDVADFVTGRAPLEKCAVGVSGTKNLMLIAAPYDIGHNVPNRAEFRAAVRAAAENEGFDYIILDTPGGFGESLYMAAEAADAAYIVVSPDLTAIRAAEKTADFLEDRGVSSRRLIINKLSGRSVRRAKNEVLGLINSTHVRLIGCIPYDSELIAAGNDGRLINEIESQTCTEAYFNIACRIVGEHVPLFDGIRKLNRLK